MKNFFTYIFFLFLGIVISYLFILLVGLFISGCIPTSKGYEQKLNTWIGMPEGQLIRSWGVPQQVFNNSGKKYFVYNSSRNVYLPGTSPTYTTTFVGNTAYTNSYGGSAAMNLNYSCKTTFEIYNQKVVSWRYNGNDCTAPEVKVDKYEEKIKYVALQTQKDKRYNRINLNTTEKKQWFKAHTKKLWNGKINKSTFVNEGLKHYPNKKYEFTFIANKLMS